MKQEHFNHSRALILVLAALGLSSLPARPDSPPAAAEPEAERASTEPNLGEALAGGDVKVSLRYRYETVSDGTPRFEDESAQASTLRFTLGYQTLSFHGFDAFAEFENVSDLGLGNEHNSLGNGVMDRPVIADPEITSLSQVFLGISAIPDTAIRGGRQEIILDNHRFVGNVGWRQHHQTFDAVKVVNKSVSRAQFYYSFLGNVHRIGGDTKPMASHLINAGVTLGKAGKLTAYGYLLDYDEEADARLSTATYGARFAGASPVGKSKLLYEGEFAFQGDHADNPNTIDAIYLRGMLGLGVGPVKLEVGIEVLGGSEADGQFSTPLATLHAFNGWADLFLATPVDGLQDVFGSLGGSFGPFSAVVIYHDFRADTGSTKYGSEVDLQALYTTPWKVVLGAKTAFYDADTFRDDKSLFTIWGAYRF